MRRTKGFTLIELLVVISIIGLLVGLSIFGLQGARAASRDAKRKADLEQIRSGIEIYKADCDVYPAALTAGTSLVGGGVGMPSGCVAGNTYISSVPADAAAPTRVYSYARAGGGQTYTLCASLEQAPVPAMSTTGCGSCGTACNYKTTNP